ncbi:MAG TPA: hypothetical protein VI911_10270 [Patescibacteria group bacterium]|nr:hypothetical protein [Patescibacteria group bacterium]
MLEFNTIKNYLYCIKDNKIGFLCGYVFIPWYHQKYNINFQEESNSLDVHGGITYENKDLERCTILLPEGKWIGFDCAHLGDLQDPEYFKLPGNRNINLSMGRLDTFKDRNYVLNEIISMIEQLGLLDDISEHPKDFILELPL